MLRRQAAPTIESRRGWRRGHPVQAAPDSASEVAMMATNTSDGPVIGSSELPRDAREPDSEDELMRALYDEYAGQLFGYAVRLTSGDRLWAEDIVQETLVRAWRSLDKLEAHGGSLRSWLCTVARRIFVDGHRSRKAR